MINKSIMQKTENSKSTEQNKANKPNEVGGIYFSSHIKIYDPNTKEVYVQKRADN